MKTGQFKIPNFFEGIPPRPSPHPSLPGPAPLYWRDEQSGRMSDIVLKFLGSHTALNEIDTEILRQYFEQWIAAPAWNAGGFPEELTVLRESVKTLKTVQEIREWYNLALDIGIDPL